MNGLKKFFAMTSLAALMAGACVPMAQADQTDAEFYEFEFAEGELHFYGPDEFNFVVWPRESGRACDTGMDFADWQAALEIEFGDLSFGSAGMVDIEDCGPNLLICVYSGEGEYQFPLCTTAGWSQLGPPLE